MVDAGSAIADNSGEVAMVDAIEISGVANSTTKFDWLEWVGVIESDEFSYEVRSLGFEPEMKKQAACVQSSAGVHKAAKLHARRLGA